LFVYLTPCVPLSLRGVKGEGEEKRGEAPLRLVLPLGWGISCGISKECYEGG